MRIVRIADFEKLPPGTVYAESRNEWEFGGWSVKGDTIGNAKNDWFLDRLDARAMDFHDTGDWLLKHEDMRDKGAAYPLTFEETERDGQFASRDALFAVMEPADVQRLIERLQKALKGA